MNTTNDYVEIGRKCTGNIYITTTTKGHYKHY